MNKILTDTSDDENDIREALEIPDWDKNISKIIQ